MHKLERFALMVVCFLLLIFVLIALSRTILPPLAVVNRDAAIIQTEQKVSTRPIAPVSESGKLGWISGVDTCPESVEYGLLIAKIVNLYPTVDVNPLNRLGSIPHGTKVEVLTTDANRGMTRVRYIGTIGYVQSLFVIDYDPRSGIQPDPESCY